MAEGSNRPMRFIHYRGTFSLKLLAIPRHGAEFVTWFLREINSRWVELIGSAKSHLAQRRSSQLQAGGASPMIIGFLLQDSQEWSRLRQIWREHYDKSCDLLRQFEEHDVFRIILTDLNITKTHNATAQGAHTNVINESNRRKNKRGTQTRPPLIECLRDQVKYLREDCGQALSDLDKETKELIELEFNLVSIYEARSSLEMAKRSIEMAKISNEMARSMKRLSWITFIFLPLMFVAGLFGMNVNVLSDDPAWQWYLVVAGPFSACVIIISLLCKYLPITDLMEGVDERLQVSFSGGTSSPTTARRTSDHQQVPTGKEFLNSQGLFFRMSGLRRRPTHVNDLESPPPVESTTPSLQ